MKTLRPEHSSFLCPPQPSSPRIYLSVVATWISTGFLRVYTLFQSLLLFLKGCWLNLRSAFISHLHLALLFLPACPSSQVCPDPSWIHQDFPSPPLLPAFITPPARPPSFLTAAKSTGASPCFILLLLFITLWGFGLSCCRPSTAVWKMLQLSKYTPGSLPRFKYSSKSPRYAELQPIFYGFFIILHE